MTGHRPGLVYSCTLFLTGPALPVNRARPRMSLTACALDGYGSHRAPAGVRRCGKPVWQIQQPEAVLASCKRHRRQLTEEGRAPHGHGLQEFPWHETPNLRFLSIVDFEEFCRTHGFRILEQVALDTSADARVESDPNLNADVAIAVLSR
jgi:hypothetical protein